MKEKTDQLIDEIVDTIVQEVAPEQIILFGSRAKGTGTKESDIDLLVIESEPFSIERSRRYEITKILKALSKYVVPKDILLFSRNEVEHWRTSVNHVIARALRDGKIVYERQ